MATLLAHRNESLLSTDVPVYDIDTYRAVQPANATRHQIFYDVSLPLRPMRHRKNRFLLKADLADRLMVSPERPAKRWLRETGYKLETLAINVSTLGGLGGLAGGAIYSILAVADMTNSHPGQTKGQTVAGLAMLSMAAATSIAGLAFGGKALCDRADRLEREIGQRRDVARRMVPWV